MANLKWREVRARCPNYIRSSDRTITCEGINPGTEMRMRFRNPQDTAEHFGSYCSRCYTRCSIYKMVYGKTE